MRSDAPISRSEAGRLRRREWEAILRQLNRHFTLEQAGEAVRLVIAQKLVSDMQK